MGVSALLMAAQAGAGSAPGDIENLSYDSKSFDCSTETGTTAVNFRFKPDGTKLYVVNTNKIYQYSLSTAWDISTASYDSKSLSISSLGYTVSFSDDGTKLTAAYFISFNGVYYVDYSLSTAWDISTAGSPSTAFQILGYDLMWRNSGNDAYILYGAGNHLREYSASTAYDASTLTYDSVALDNSSELTGETHFAVNNDGTKVIIGANASKIIYQYGLTTAYDLSTGSYDSISHTCGAEITTPRSIQFGDDDQKFYILDASDDTIHQYSVG